MTRTLFYKVRIFVVLAFCTLCLSYVMLTREKNYFSIKYGKEKINTAIKSSQIKEPNSNEIFDSFAVIPPPKQNRTLDLNCFKKYENQTYTICKDLPYSEIKCGPKYSQSKPETNGTFQVPDVVFFVWFGSNLPFRFYNYLALRSAAAIQQPERIDFYYSVNLPVGKQQLGT